jgi:hypothetical protein
MSPDGVIWTFNVVVNRIFGPLIDDCWKIGADQQQLVNADGFGFVR